MKINFSIEWRSTKSVRLFTQSGVKEKEKKMLVRHFFFFFLRNKVSQAMIMEKFKKYNNYIKRRLFVWSS